MKQALGSDGITHDKDGYQIDNDASAAFPVIVLIELRSHWLYFDI